MLNSLIIKIFKITVRRFSKKSEGRGSGWKRVYSALICLLSRQSSLACVCPALCRRCQSIGARANAGAKLVTELKCSIGHGGKNAHFTVTPALICYCTGVTESYLTDDLEFVVY